MAAVLVKIQDDILLFDLFFPLKKWLVITSKIGFDFFTFDSLRVVVVFFFFIAISLKPNSRYVQTLLLHFVFFSYFLFNRLFNRDTQLLDEQHCLIIPSDFAKPVTHHKHKSI